MRILSGSCHLSIVAIMLFATVGLSAACSDVSSDTNSETNPSENGEPGPGKEGPIPAEFGLDARPPNTTCIAPPRPPTTSAVKIEQVFANVAVEHVTAMAQPPGDKSRWYVASR